MTTGQIISEARIKSGYSKNMLAEFLGIRVWLLDEFERDTQVPDYEMCKLMARYLNVDLFSLMMPDNETLRNMLASFYSYMARPGISLKEKTETVRKLSDSYFEFICTV